MKNIILKNFNTFALVALLAGFFCTINAPAFADKTKLHHYFHDFPWIGLVSNEITYGPITVSNVHLNKGGKVALVKPNDKIKGNLHYKIDAKSLNSFHLYHLVVGIKKIGAQDCISHSFGIWNSKGKGNFTLQAPSEPGVYEVRFSYFEGATCQSARKAWNEEASDPSSAATIAVVIVE